MCKLLQKYLFCDNENSTANNIRVVQTFNLKNCLYQSLCMRCKHFNKSAFHVCKFNFQHKLLSTSLHILSLNADMCGNAVPTSTINYPLAKLIYNFH